MASYNKQTGVTLIVKNQTIPYYGNMNIFFGGSSDYVAMLYFGSITALGANELVSGATVRCEIKGDTAPGSGFVQLGLIAGAWDGTTSGGASALASYLTGNMVSSAVSFSMTPMPVSFGVAPLLSAWAANPGAYSGIYIRNASLPLARISASQVTLTVDIVTRGTPTAPGSFTASPSDFPGGSVALAWGASSVDNDSIAGYTIQYATSSDGSAWSSWTVLKSAGATTASDSPAMAIGSFRKYRVCAYTSGGQTSGWTESNTVKRIDGATGVPANIQPVPGWYETFTDISWDMVPGAAGYRGQKSVDSGATWQPDGGYILFPAYQRTMSMSADFAALGLNQAMMIRVASESPSGDISAFAYSGKYYKNIAPLVPSLIAPAGDTVTGGAHLVVRANADPNNHVHSMRYRIGGGEWILPSATAGVVGTKYLALRVTQSGVYEFQDTDEYGLGGPILTKTVTVTAAAYTDPLVVAGETPIRAAHINELRARVDSVRAAYGLPAPNWAEDVLADSTSWRGFSSHVAELRGSVDGVIAYLNSLGAGALVAPPTWIPSVDGPPLASIVTQLRTVLDKL